MKFSVKIMLGSLTVGVCLLGLPRTVLGCTCDLPVAGKTVKHQVKDARGQSKAVFSGKVAAVNSDTQGAVEVKFKILRSWKLHSAAEVTIRTGHGSGDCGYHFEVGKSYLVYAYGADENSLQTNICQRTRLLADATEDLKVLGNGKRPTKSQDPSRASL